MSQKQNTASALHCKQCLFSVCLAPQNTRHNKTLQRDKHNSTDSSSKELINFDASFHTIIVLEAIR